MSDKCRVVSVAELNPFSPVLVNFEYGFNSEVDNSKLKCGVYVDSEKREQKTVIIEKDKKHFVGKTPSEEMSRILILVRNRKTNEARIYVSQSCTLVDSTREENTRKRKRDDIQKINRTDEAVLHEHSLQLSFGSKKSKRAFGATVRAQMNAQTDKEQLTQAVSGVKVKLSDLDTSSLGENDLLRLIPPCNRKASLAEEVYQVHDLLTKEELDSLMPAAEFLINNSLAEMDEKNSYFLFTHYKLLGSNPDPTKIALLIYGSSLVTFFNMSAGVMRSKDSLQKMCPQSRIIANKILNVFTVLSNNTRTRPSFCKDKIVCHVMILVLLACNYQMNIETISNSLKGFGKKKLVQLARVVGLSARRQSSNIYFLKFPIPPLPKIRLPKKSSV